MPQPWSNLSAKFQDVIDLLTAQNAKLDALQQTLDYGLLTQADPPAPRIPYLLQVRVMLEEVKAALIGTGTDPTDIRTAIWGLAGPAPGTTLTDLYTLLARALITETTPEIPYLLQLRVALGMPPATNAESIQQILMDYKDTFGDRGAGMTLYNMLDSMYINTAGLLQDTDAINAAIGGVPHNSLEIASVRGLLNALRLCACEGNTGPPLTGDDAICASPYRSSGMVVVPWSLIGGTSVMFATFPDPPPSGVSFGSVFGIGEDRGELVSSTWSAWRVWVTSEASQFAMDDGVTRYPCNEWVPMAGTGSRAFSVDARYALTVVLCRDGGVDSGICVSGTSKLVFSEDESNHEHRSWDVVTALVAAFGGSIASGLANGIHTVYVPPPGFADSHTISVRKASIGPDMWVADGSGYVSLQETPSVYPEWTEPIVLGSLLNVSEGFYLAWWYDTYEWEWKICFNNNNTSGP